MPKLGPAGQAALPTLMELLDEPFPELANNAAESIGYLGPIARSALPKLRELMDKPEHDGAARSVLRLDPTDSKAQDIVARSIDAEHDIRVVCRRGEPSSLSCVMSLKKDGLPTLRKVSLTTPIDWPNSVFRSLLYHWGEHRVSSEYEYLEPLLRDHLETSDSELGKRFREALKRRAEQPAR